MAWDTGGVVSSSSFPTSATSLRVLAMVVRAALMKKVGMAASIHNEANGIDLGGGRDDDDDVIEVVELAFTWR